MRIAPVILSVFFVTLLPLEGVSAYSAETVRSFATPIDGLSVNMPDASQALMVSGWDGARWTEPQEARRDDEHDPALTESNLILFSTPVTRVRFSGNGTIGEIHPIEVSKQPATFWVAAAGDMGSQRILTRKQWGADESLRVTTKTTSSSSEDIGDNGDTGQSTSTGRVRDCEDAYEKFPEEFKSSAPVTQNDKGERLRWPLQYSPEVRLLAVHHTAITVSGDTRPGIERMRALYQYHAQNRGWGDIGYHFLIDEKGEIYEGRAGGDFVVGGHAYCNNVGTVGVALMGSFDKEQPTQAQAQSLQWLLQLLAAKYNMNLQRNVAFHGKTLPRIVGHRQLVSTECPGYTMWEALDQIRANVKTGNVTAAVTFPQLPSMLALPNGKELTEEEGKSIPTNKDGLATLGSTRIEGRPGADVIIPLFFRASRKSYNKNARIARVTRRADLKVWQERDGKYDPVRGDIRIPVPLVKAGESIVLRVKVRLPPSAGTHNLKIGTLQYSLEANGRRARTPQVVHTNGGMRPLLENPAPTARPTVVPSPSPSSISSSATTSASSPTIRVMLTPDVPIAGMTCASVDIQRTNGLSRITGYFQSARQYRGMIECQMIDERVTLINSLSLEEYLMGLAEEPDTEPYEKQRAFAIAARTYALHYMDSMNRKFPGKPYDASDSPATFQAYRGYDFEKQNPRWLQAVENTNGRVLTYAGKVIRPPYYSSNDGKTRTPAEAGWGNFPFGHIFTSKPDPWCEGMTLRGHGVGMSGCGAEGQANEGKTGEQILSYYYPGTTVERR